MVGFSEQLHVDATPEWAEKYIDYEHLKTLCLPAKEGQSRPQQLELSFTDKPHCEWVVLQTKVATQGTRDAIGEGAANFVEAEGHFFSALDQEMAKVETFFGEKLSGWEHTLSEIERQAEFVKMQKLDRGSTLKRVRVQRGSCYCRIYQTFSLTPSLLFVRRERCSSS